MDFIEKGIGDFIPADRDRRQRVAPFEPVRFQLTARELHVVGQPQCAGKMSLQCLGEEWEPGQLGVTGCIHPSILRLARETTCSRWDGLAIRKGAVGMVMVLSLP